MPVFLPTYAPRRRRPCAPWTPVSSLLFGGSLFPPTVWGLVRYRVAAAQMIFWTSAVLHHDVSISALQFDIQVTTELGMLQPGKIRLQQVMGRNQGSKNKAGHSAGGARKGSGPKKKTKPEGKHRSEKSLGKRKKRDDDSEAEPIPPRRGVSPSSPLRSASAGTSTTAPPARPMKPLKLHPMFRELLSLYYSLFLDNTGKGQNSASNKSSSGSSTPNVAPLPFVPVLIPEGPADPCPIPSDIVEEAPHSDCSNVLPNPSGSDTSDPAPEAEPSLEGIVQQYLVDTMKDIRDRQLKLHGLKNTRARQ
ncbi:hypothetical protein R3P38DRAFT_2797841 [Favolaschia claudopus]|uniref:Uncharacterized protein n=1 Tax=Favolaschia claudopus TaxID=2862362 RepID=A0AAW0A2K9_9AGAR